MSSLSINSPRPPSPLELGPAFSTQTISPLPKSIFSFPAPLPLIPPAFDARQLSNKKISRIESVAFYAGISSLAKVGLKIEIRKYPCGREERGTFVRDQLHGQGEVFLNGHPFEYGNYENGELIKGVKYSDDDIILSGTFRKNQLCGFGEVFKSGKLMEEGCYVNGQLMAGKRYTPCGKVSERGIYGAAPYIMKCGYKYFYYGQSADQQTDILTLIGDCCDGIGQIYKNKKLFGKGKFSSGMLCQGIKILECGKILRGEFAISLLHGIGTISRTIVHDGVSKEVVEQKGTFSYGLLKKGRMLVDGDIYEGEFVDNLLEGLGVIHKADGSTISGLFRKGELTLAEEEFYDDETEPMTDNP